MSFHLQDELTVTAMLLRERKAQLEHLKRHPPRRSEPTEGAHARLEKKMSELKRRNKRAQSGGMSTKKGGTYCQSSGMRLF